MAFDYIVLGKGVILQSWLRYTPDDKLRTQYYLIVYKEEAVQAAYDMVCACLQKLWNADVRVSWTNEAFPGHLFVNAVAEGLLTDRREGSGLKG